MRKILFGVRDVGPYLLVLLLPGGSLIALLMWLYRRHSKRGDELRGSVRRLHRRLELEAADRAQAARA